MKGKLFIALLVSLMLLNSCYMDYGLDEIHACFSTRYNEYAVGERVEFENCSEYADYFEWDFGDGTYSKASNPVHAYTRPGVYEVKLIAYNNHGLKEYAYLTVKVINTAPTELNILVKYYGTSDPVSNCDLAIYTNYDDWYNIKNHVASGFTSSQGIISFTNLKPVVYYIDAYKKINETSYYSNEKLVIKTAPLELGKINYYDIYIEYFINSSGKKIPVIKQIVKAEKR